MSVSKKISKKATGPAPAKAKAKPKAEEPSRVRGRNPEAKPEKVERLAGSEAAGDEAVLDNTPDDESSKAKASTAARAHAAKLGIDLSTVKGTGKGGIITKTDVDSASKADVAKYEKEMSPIPGTMGLLREGDVETGPDYGAFGLDEEQRAAQLEEALRREEERGTGGEMIRVLSDWNRLNRPLPTPEKPGMDTSLLSAPLPGPAMDMSRLAGAKLPPLDLPSPASAMDMSGLDAANFPPPGPQAGISPIDLSALFDHPGPSMDMSKLDAANFPRPSPVPQSAMDLSRISGDQFPGIADGSPDAFRPGQYQSFTPAGGAPGEYGPSPFTPSGGTPGEYGPPLFNEQGGMPGEYGPSPFNSSGGMPGEYGPQQQSRGVSGALSDAAGAALGYAKKHPFYTAGGILGLTALGMANARGGGGSTMPTAEEMEALARERDEARAAAAQGFRQGNTAPLTMPR